MGNKPTPSERRMAGTSSELFGYTAVVTGVVLSENRYDRVGTYEKKPTIDDGNHHLQHHRTHKAHTHTLTHKNNAAAIGPSTIIYDG